jgi:tetratricopeptide (TPR) repeat protein
MNRMKRVAGLAMSASLCWMLGSAATAQAPAGGQDAGKQPPYTMPEYNAEQACANDKNPSSQVKCLDDFVSKYPNSNLLIYVYPMYYQAYFQLKNHAKVIEYADKMVALGDKADANSKYAALYARALAFGSMDATGQAGQAKGALEAAEAGLKLIAELKKPDNLDEAAFAEQKKQAASYLNGTAAQAAMVGKDYPNAIKYYKAVLAGQPKPEVEAITEYRLGTAYLGSNPPQQMDGFWHVARAITSKGATQQQVTQLKTYLRKLVVNYQQAACDNLIDAEFNELLQLAGSSPDKPDTYKIPSAVDLDAARKDMTIASVITDLKVGGDKAKVTWLASCGLEFPDVPGKLMEITPGATANDPIVLKVAFVTSDAEFQAATTPNMEAKVVGQPEAAKLEKDNPVRFTGTLMSYDPDPAFMLHWDKAKVNAEDIPADKTPAKKPPVRRPAPKKP